MMDKKLLKDSLGWGFVLWIIGYVLGIVLFPVLPPALLGWAIMPIGILITLWVLFKKVSGGAFQYYVILAVVWAVIAIVFDYLFIVRLFNPVDGYYKLDVYLYYALTFIIPLVVGWWKTKKLNEKIAR
jgi:hypothetical protein